MAKAVISNFSASESIVDSINEAKTKVGSALSSINTSQSNLPNKIKSDFMGKYQSLVEEINTIIGNCESAARGIEENVSNYVNFEQLEQGSISANLAASITDSNLFIWGYLTTNDSYPQRAGSEFFSNLKVGTYDSVNNVYYLDAQDGSHYEYYVDKGRLYTYYSNSNKPVETVVGYYYPSNYSDLSALNTITFLPGSGEHPKQNPNYILDTDPQYSTVQQVIASSTAALLIVPQKNQMGKENNFDYIRYRENIVNSSLFAQEFMEQDDDAKNSIIGYSNGGISALYIASENGRDVYDTVVVANGFMDTRTKLDNLRDKEIIVLTSANDKFDGKIKGVGSIYESVKSMAKAGLTNVNVITGDKKLYSLAEDMGFIAQFREDENFRGHASCVYAVTSSNIMEYLGVI